MASVYVNVFESSLCYLCQRLNMPIVNNINALHFKYHFINRNGWKKWDGWLYMYMYIHVNINKYMVATRDLNPYYVSIVFLMPWFANIHR